MPFSRYQIRNEFNLADPEVYKAADRDDPEALLEGVAMAGLVGVLRQLGDLAEFAAEIFHGLHEEVMVTASRGHGLLTRVQQIESDFHSIEKVFLSQTRHSAFFTRAGIRWHPNLQTEQNLITKGDVPRFVMDSYEECRGPPQLFLLDKFDVAGAGACLKRYTDPSAYKLEAPSYEMMKGETQRDKKIRNAKKKGSRWKNGEAPDVFQLSHVKLHQLLLEERVQNGASNPARRAKLKKRESKFPFYTDTGKRYMENLLNSPPEDKLVHEVKVVNSSMHLSTNRSEEREVETFEVRIVNSPLLDDIEEKHISVHGEHKDVFEVDNQSDNMASETDNYMDALATMESEFETDVEFRAANADPIIKQETFSNSNIEQFKSQFSDSQSASDDKYSSTKNQIRTFSYSDSTINSPNNMSPRSGTSPHAFAITEIPFRPRVLPTKISDDCIEVSNNADLLVDQETVFKDTNCNESDLSPKFLNNLVDVGSPAKKEETEIDPEEITASVIVEDNNSNCTFVNSHVEEQPCVPSLDKLDICLESISDPAEARISYSSKEETELGNTETASVDSESQNANVAVCEPYDFESNEIKDLATTEQPGENRSVISASGIVQNSKESVEKKEFSDRLLISPELDSILSAYYDHSSIRFLDGIHNRNKNHIVDPSTEKVSIELGEKKESSEESVISPELGSISSRSYDHSNLQNLDSIHKDLNESDVDNSSTENESISFGGKKESSEKSLITLESDYMPSASYNLSNLHLDSMSTWATCNGGNGNDVENPYESLEIVEDETIFVTEETDQNGLQLHVSPDVDFQSTTQFVDSEPDSGDLAEAQESKSSKFVVQDGQIEELEAASSIFSHSVPIEENADQLETLDSHNHVEQDSVEPSMINTSKFLPKLAPINMEEMPPLPPLPPMEWRLGKLHNPSLISPPDGGQHDIHRFPPSETRRSLNQNEVATKEKSECDYEVNAVNPEEKFAPQPPFESVESQNDVISGPEITWLSSTSSLPSGDDEMPNSIRPMKIQRPRTPLIDAVATHDKNKLRKLSERAMPLFPKEEERNTFLEQIRAKSFNLKPAVKSRPIIPGPTTNLRVAAILEKANAIRQAFAGSDDDEDDNDSWSDS